MRLRVGNTRLRIGSTRLAVGSGGTVTPPQTIYASTFSVAISPSSSTVGSNVAVTVAPIGGAWPATSAITGTYSGPGGSFAAASVVAGSMSPVSFNGSTNTAGTGLINATISGMTSTGGQTYTATAASVYVPPTPSVPIGQATRVDLISSKSAIAPGTAVPMQIVPNANWAGQTLTLAVSKGTGTLSATTITAPSSGNATLTFNYTPTLAGEHAITIAGTSLYSPLAHPINCWTPSSGNAGTMTAALNRLDKAPHQYNVFGIKPLGFENMPGYPGYVNPGGWSRVGVTVNLASPTNGLFMRLIDAESTGATTMLGTGSYITSAPVQVYGPLTAGSHNINLLLPAGLWMYFGEIATDAAFTNPVRISKRFFAGLVMSCNQRSYECAIARNYGNTTVPISQLGQTFGLVVTDVSYDERYGVAGNAWYQHDGVTPGPDYLYGEGSSAGTMRLGALVAYYMGMRLGITGLSRAGGGIITHINHDGSPCDGFAGTIPNVENEYRWYWANNAGWDGGSEPESNQTFQESTGRIIRNVDWVMLNNPACAVVGMGLAGNGLDGDGSALTMGAGAFFPQGETRMLDYVMASLGAHVRRKTAVGSINGNNVAGHPNQAARTGYAEMGFRAFFASELAAFGGLQTSQTGPVLGAAATRTGNTIYAPFSHQGGTTMVSHACDYSNGADPTRNFVTATGAELASLFALYAGANGCANSGAAVVHTDSAEIDNANSRMVLHLTPGQTLPSVLTMHFNADFNVSNSALASSNRAAFLTDERTDSGAALPYGWQMQSKLDIPVTVSA